MNAHTPSAWAHAYVGLPYILGVGECAHRAALVWRERFGLEVEVSAAHGNMDVAQRLIRAALADPAWQAVDEPAEGDAVVMWKGERVAHLGVWVAPGHVLHCTRARGMTLTDLQALPAEGFRLYDCFRRGAAAMALAA